MKNETYRTRYYSSFDDDFVTSGEQDYRLPDNYAWIRRGITAKLLSKITYFLAFTLGGAYCRLFLHLRIKNRKALKECKDGCFIYGNHTQPFGDVIIPALCAFPKRIYTVVSPSNLGLRYIGKLLTYLGALPVPNSIKGLRKLTDAIKTRTEEKNCIVIYPEAHVWEYCSFIRPYADTSFLYPARLKKPSYCMTAVYKERRFGKKPYMTVYIDGPFFPDESLNEKERATALRDIIFNQMQVRSKQSDCEYIKYVKKET